MDVTRITALARAGGAPLLVALSTRPDTIALALELASSHAAIIVGHAVHLPDALPGCLRPVDALRQLRGPAPSPSLVVTFSDQLAALDPRPIYVRLGSVEHAISSFELICAAKHSAQVTVEGHGGTWTAGRHASDTHELAHRIATMLARAEQVPGSLAERLSAQRLRSTHLQRERMRIREYCSCVLDHWYRGALEASVAAAAIDSLHALERQARREAARAG